MHKYDQHKKGFTIVELLIVIIVIAVLATITIVVFTGVQQRARDSLRDTNVGNLLKKAEVSRVETGDYPATFHSAPFTGGSCNELAAPQLLAMRQLGIPPELLKNPSAPKEVPVSLVVVNGNHREYSDLTPDEYPTCSYTPTPVSTGGANGAQWGSIAALQADLIAVQMQYMTDNPIDFETSTNEERQAYIANFFVANPQFSCGFDSQTGMMLEDDAVRAACNIPEPSGEEEAPASQQTSPKDHYYVRPTYGPWNCSGPNPVSGLIVNYWNESRGEWVERVIGGGSPSGGGC